MQTSASEQKIDSTLHLSKRALFAYNIAEGLLTRSPLLDHSKLTHMRTLLYELASIGESCDIETLSQEQRELYEYRLLRSVFHLLPMDNRFELSKNLREAADYV